MSERAEVLREFTRTVEHCEFASDDVLYAHGMADEIVRLRSQLAAADRELKIAKVCNDSQAEHINTLTLAKQTAERERDEARRERDQWRVRSTEHQCNSEQWHSRAERMERVVEAAKEYVKHPSQVMHTYIVTGNAYLTLLRAVNALDAAEGTP